MEPEAMAFVHWSAQEWLHFLRWMPREGFTYSHMKLLDDAFRFSVTGNSELASMWFILALRTGYRPAYASMDAFLSTVGRRKFLEAIYKEMMMTPENADMAKRIYNRYRQNYHPLAQESLDRIVLKING